MLKIILEAVFVVLMVVWAIDNIYVRQSLRGWIPWICVAILGVMVVALPVLGSSLR